MTAAEAEIPGRPKLQRRRKTIVVVDVVESVRLMHDYEDDVIERWRSFSSAVRDSLLPRHGGRVVKSLGDGLLLEFDSAANAASASLAIQQAIGAYNVDRVPQSHIHLRLGAHISDVVVDHDDIYGSGVNLAARLASIAGPAEIVVSSELRDALVPGLDAAIEDLGECFVKHVHGPVRAFRIGAIGEYPVVRATEPASDLRALVAVIPFDYRSLPDNTDLASIGDLIADGVIALLSGNANLRVVSRMSSAAFRGRNPTLESVAFHLDAAYLLSGSYFGAGTKLVVTAEIADIRKDRVVWSQRITVDAKDLFTVESELLATLVAALNREITFAEATVTRLQPPPTLQSYSLQIGSISLMHSSSHSDFVRVREILEFLIERHPRSAAPRAWLAKWYVLRVTRGLVHQIADDAAMAMDHTRRALDADPTCSLAMAMQGFVQCHMLKDLDTAMKTLQNAIAMNPSDSLARLFKGVVHSFWGEGESALSAMTEARRLSPLDPLAHYYDALSVPAALAAKQFELAVQFAERSLGVNRGHSPTWRALAIAQSELGRMDQARITVNKLLELEPGLTVDGYLSRSPAGANETRRRYADALARAGLPTR